MRRQSDLLSSQTQVARSEATRGALIKSARELFGDIGYHDTAMNELVGRASVTRGALYHHFTDKRDLFYAVARQVSEGLSDEASQAALLMSGGTWDKLLEGLKTYLKLIVDNPKSQRILLIDGPAVLGWKRWRQLQSDVIIPGMVYTLRLLMEEGTMHRQNPEPLAHLLVATVNDAALTIANSANPTMDYEDFSAALTLLIKGLRTEHCSHDN